MEKAAVVSIHKKGSFHSVANNRPVSFTIVLCKVQERVIMAAFYQHLLRNGILSDAQNGFVHRRSCPSNLLTFPDGVMKLTEDGRCVDACYFYFNKPFDLINLRLLIHKMEALRIGSECFHWVRSFLNGRVFRLRVERETSTLASVRSGVPQGSVIYIFDISSFLTRNCLLFGDDVKL